jgi:hypothetical protein
LTGGRIQVSVLLFEKILSEGLAGKMDVFLKKGRDIPEFVAL